MGETFLLRDVDLEECLKFGENSRGYVFFRIAKDASYSIGNIQTGKGPSLFDGLTNKEMEIMQAVMLNSSNVTPVIYHTQREERLCHESFLESIRIKENSADHFSYFAALINGEFVIYSPVRHECGVRSEFVNVEIVNSSEIGDYMAKKIEQEQEDLFSRLLTNSHCI